MADYPLLDTPATTVIEWERQPPVSVHRDRRVCAPVVYRLGSKYPGVKFYEVAGSNCPDAVCRSGHDCRSLGSPDLSHRRNAQPRTAATRTQCRRLGPAEMVEQSARRARHRAI